MRINGATRTLALLLVALASSRNFVESHKTMGSINFQVKTDKPCRCAECNGLIKEPDTTQITTYYPFETAMIGTPELNRAAPVAIEPLLAIPEYEIYSRPGRRNRIWTKFQSNGGLYQNSEIRDSIPRISAYAGGYGLSHNGEESIYRFTNRLPRVQLADPVSYKMAYKNYLTHYTKEAKANRQASIQEERLSYGQLRPPKINIMPTMATTVSEERLSTFDKPIIELKTPAMTCKCRKNENDVCVHDVSLNNDGFKWERKFPGDTTNSDLDYDVITSNEDDSIEANFGSSESNEESYYERPSYIRRRYRRNFVNPRTLRRANIRTNLHLGRN